ncbi:MAG: TonB-dependent receptor plug domain-containing protein, partial [Prolixibacteraceae bacterium]
MHIDRELYSPGEDIWFKSYLVSGINHILIPGYKNIYVQLLSDSGKVMLNRLLLSEDGTAKGDFQLPADLPDGNYYIRAYTKYLQNFGDDSFFYRKIAVHSPKNSLEQYEEKPLEQVSSIDVAFLPESGNLVENALNYMAFKAIDETGKGIPVKGKVVDDSGTEIVSFKSKYKGMGRFAFMPQEGKTYFAELDDYPGYRHRLKDAQPNAVSLHYKPDGNYLLFTLNRNLKLNYPQEFTLIASHKSKNLFHSQITMDNFQHALKLYKGLFPLGISKVTLFDKQNQVMAERLVFVQNENDKKIELDLNKSSYSTRGKVELDITSLLPQLDTINTALSLAVVHEDYLDASGNNQTIESYLLLDSELKGSLESPASLFTGEENISSDEKLDLVMMVNGWRSYYWKDLNQYAGEELAGWADYGLSLEGRVTKLWGGKPVDDGKVVLGPFSDSFLFVETRTDKQGSFEFDRLYLKDSAKIMLNAETKNGNKRTVLDLEQHLAFDSTVTAGSLDELTPDLSIPWRFYRKNYYRHKAETEFEVESGTILLGDVDVTEKELPRGLGHFKIYGEPDYSLEVTDDDIHYLNVLDFLENRLPGVIVGRWSTGKAGGVSIRGGGQPLLVVDGVEIMEENWNRIVEIPMGDIAKIEVMKTGYATAAFGSKGGDGVISILTKVGKGEWEGNWERNVRGRITPVVQGYRQPRKFYSPKYPAGQPDELSSRQPDYRPTLYWNPDVKLENGRAKVEFYTSDDVARYRIFVEGISKNGKICTGTGVLNVSNGPQ